MGNPSKPKMNRPARRIMEGTMEGRAILNVLESQGYLHLEPLE